MLSQYKTRKAITDTATEPDIEDSCYSAGKNKSRKEKTVEDSDEDVSVEFTENVVKWVKLDNMFKTKQQEMKEIKKQRNICEDFVLKYLTEIDEQSIEIGNGKLLKNEKETKSSLKQEIIKEVLMDKLKDANLVKEIIDQMEAKRIKKKKMVLKRKNNR